MVSESLRKMGVWWHGKAGNVVQVEMRSLVERPIRSAVDVGQQSAGDFILVKHPTQNDAATKGDSQELRLL